MQYNDNEKWKQTITDQLLNGFFYNEKKDILDNVIFEYLYFLSSTCI